MSSDRLPTTGLAAPIRLKRGFAVMDPTRLREISSKAGKASQATGKANRFREGSNAKIAGRRGGLASGKVRGAKKAAPPAMLVTGGAATDGPDLAARTIRGE